MTTSAPAFSVVIPAYNANGRIGTALRSLQRQTLRSFEVIIVDSGSDTSVPTVQQLFPPARVIRSGERLWPGAARNRGVAAARGEFVAFLADDCAACPDWLAERLRMHRLGYDVVGGAVTNAHSKHPIGTGEYLFEYSALLPHGEVLAEQEIPHALSFRRTVLEAVGPYPEDTLTGEDTLLGRRCIDANLRIGFAPRATVAHSGSTHLLEMLRHAYAHGRGLAQCVHLHGLDSHLHATAFRGIASGIWTTCSYAPRSWRHKLLRLRRGAPRLVPAFLALSPIILLASITTTMGAWREYARRSQDRITTIRVDEGGEAP